MRSRNAVLLGTQMPQIEHLAVDVASLDAAEECLELAEFYGPPRDEAQKHTIRSWMGQQADGKWAAYLAAHAMSRQNGKGDEVEDRELFGLVVLAEPIIHTAHEVPTSKNAHLRLVNRIEAHPDLRRQVRRISYGNGDLGIEMKNGGVIAYRARTAGGGRGLDDIALVVYDEAQHLQAEHMTATSPTLAVNPNPQIIMTGSAGLATSAVWWEKRIDALLGRGRRFVYLEHTAEQVSVKVTDEGEVVESIRPDPTSKEARAAANPAYGTRISDEYLDSQLGLLKDHLFSREHLGVWDPMPTATRRASVIPSEKWAAAMDAGSRRSGKVALGVDVAPESASSSLAVVGGRSDGRYHVEVVDSAEGTGWLLARVEAVLKRGQVGVMAVDGGGPVGSLLPGLRTLADRHRVKLVEYSGREYAGACAGFVDAVIDDLVRHLGQAWLATAIGGASKRSHGKDVWMWDRTEAKVDISPLVAVTVGLRAFQQERPADRRSAYEDDGLTTV